MCGRFRKLPPVTVCVTTPDGVTTTVAERDIGSCHTICTAFNRGGVRRGCIEIRLAGVDPYLIGLEQVVSIYVTGNIVHGTDFIIGDTHIA